VADVRISDGPPMLRSENARLAGFVYVDIRGRDLKSAVQEPCCAYPRAVGEAGVGAFGAAPFEPPGPAVDASVRVSRRSFSPWI
jgi:hypothetical protein